VWKVIQVESFAEWFKDQDTDAQADMVTKIAVLSQYGPRLGRPYADSIKESQHPNMKELRIQSKGRPFRVFYAFDPKRKAVLLVGGNKEGAKRFYKKMIPKADKLFDEYLEEYDEKKD